MTACLYDHLNSRLNPHGNQSPVHVSSNLIGSHGIDNAQNWNASFVFVCNDGHKNSTFMLVCSITIVKRMF